MSENYVLRDIDNRDDDGAPYEFTVTSLAEMIPYVDGPLRSDITGAEEREELDETIEHLRRERFDLAEPRLRELGVYIRLEIGESLKGNRK